MNGVRRGAASNPSILARFDEAPHRIHSTQYTGARWRRTRRSSSSTASSSTRATSSTTAWCVISWSTGLPIPTSRVSSPPPSHPPHLYPPLHTRTLTPAGGDRLHLPGRQGGGAQQREALPHRAALPHAAEAPPRGRGRLQRLWPAPGACVGWRVALTTARVLGEKGVWGRADCLGTQRRASEEKQPPLCLLARLPSTHLTPVLSSDSHPNARWPAS